MLLNHAGKLLQAKHSGTEVDDPNDGGPIRAKSAGGK
jgi:hypothetical protein